MATTNTNQPRTIRGYNGPLGWIYYALSNLDETINAGSIYTIDLTTDVNEVYTERKFWNGPDPAANVPANETVGPIIGTQRTSLLIDLELGIDLTGIAGNHAGIEVGIYKAADGFYWKSKNITWGVDEYPLFQSGGVGQRVGFVFEIGPYWKKETTPGNYDDLLEGFGLTINNRTSGNTIRITGGNLTIKGFNQNQ